MLGKITTNIKIAYKSHFYLKSTSLKTDFSLYKKAFKLWHPRYFDIDRRTEYESKHRDFKKLKFKTQDPLHYDNHTPEINGGFPRVKLNLKINLSI
jgi:hypothetical protein